MKLNALKKRSLRIEQLENRELLSATTWNLPSQADAAIAAEMAAVVADAPVDLRTTLLAAELAANQANAFSAAELDATAEAATWLVTLNHDDGSKGTLRWAVENASAGDTVKFAASMQNETIKLTQGQIVIDKDLTISAYELYRFEDLPSSIYDVDCTGLTIDAQGESRIFSLAEGANVKVVGVKMTNASIRGDWTPDQGPTYDTGDIHDSKHSPEWHGGALHVPAGATLKLEACVVSNSQAIMGGGAVAVSGELSASNTIFEGNDGGADHGGAIRIFNGYVEVVDCYFRDNAILPHGDGKTSGGGGAVAASGG
ncbi:MAG: hypothetical protein IKU86_09700, partial [Thermoguttaceae bacterium]|nr:hypothetical protein [Thermoguttaceae bacterium]